MQPAEARTLVAARLSGSVPTRALACLLLLGGWACSNFRTLRTEVSLMEKTSVVGAVVENASQYTNVYGLVVEWDRDSGKVLSADVTKVGDLGVFAFFVESPLNQYVMAYSDRNGNSRYDAGEPGWIYSDATGKAVPVQIDPRERKARVSGRLSESAAPPAELVDEGQEFLGTRTREEAMTGWRIPVSLGDVADLDDPRFSAVRGEEGMWRPASFPRDTGVGIYFLEPYDPGRVPVLFVYGIAGSPQDWRPFFSMMDRKKYQPWFCLYPSGRRLDEVATGLNRSVEILQAHLGFSRLHVVAHSMGGLVSRAFLIKNVLDDGNHYVTRFVSISTPWGGHEAAAMGVRFSPAVVPSWRDMVEGSEFQKAILSRPLHGSVDHLLVYGTHSSFSLVLPEKNDGTVSVASELAAAARADAAEIVGFDADHVGILSLPEVVQTVEEFLGRERQ